MNQNVLNNTCDMVSESELASLLSYFNENFVYDIVNTQFTNRVSYYTTDIVNIAASCDQYFKKLLEQFPDRAVDIKNTSNTVYYNIITIICQKYNLAFTQDPNIDLFSAAYWMYEFFICKFSDNLCKFFTSYIIKEKNELYEIANLVETKKNKDSSTIYNKKIFRNSKLAVISANLESVIYNMKAFDIDLPTILSFVYDDQTIARFIANIILPNGNFYLDHYCYWFSAVEAPILLTNIRLAIQQDNVENEAIINNIMINGGETNE